MEKDFKVLIVDDEPEARNLLRTLLDETGLVKIVGEAGTVESALYQMVEHYPNLVLLDINMPGRSGMELVNMMHKSNVDIPVVFISAYEQYALDALRNGVYDFILKPVEKKELVRVIKKYQRLDKKDFPAKLMELLNSIKEKSRIKINSRHSYILVDPSDIVYCVSEEGYTNIYLNNGKVEVSNTSLNQIELKTVKHHFYRLGRSLLVNPEYIYTVNKTSNSCVLKNQELEWTISAPRNAIKTFLKNQYNYA